MYGAATPFKRFLDLRPAAQALLLGAFSLFAILDVRQMINGLFGPQDEGILLVYPDLIIRGYVPYKEFAALYPPAEFYLLAGVYRVFGESVAIERLLGAASLIFIVTAVFLIGSRVNRSTGAFAAAVALGYTTLFWNGAAFTKFAACACMLFTLVFASANCRESAQPVKRYMVLAGVAAGSTLLFRQDLGGVALIAGLVAIDPGDSRRVRPFLAGVAIPVSALLIFSWVAGWAAVFDSLVLDPLRSAPGRFVPLQPNWELGVVAACVTVQCVIAIRVRGPRAPRQLIRLARGMATLSMGYSISLLHRTGPESIGDYGFLVVSLTVVSLSILWLHLVIDPRRQMTGAFASFLAAMLPLGIAYLTQDSAIELTQGWVSSGDRKAPVLIFKNSKTSDLQDLLNEINRKSHSGQGVFVGQTDLRFANYNDTFVYFLLPKLRPVSRYLEMNPGCANRPGSGLTEHLSKADWLILTTRYDGWKEPNASMIAGSAEPNDFVRRNFCLESQHGDWRLLYRCGSGSDRIPSGSAGL